MNLWDYLITILANYTHRNTVLTMTNQKDHMYRHLLKRLIVNTIKIIIQECLNCAHWNMSKHKLHRRPLFIGLNEITKHLLNTKHLQFISLDIE